VALTIACVATLVRHVKNQGESSLLPGTHMLTKECLAIAFVGILSACGNADTPTATTTPVASVAISPSISALTVGETAQFSATPRDAAGNSLGGRTVTWTSSDPSKASVSSTGLVTAIAVGSVTISATVEGRAGSVQFTVAAAQVASVTIAPSNFSLGVGQTKQLVAIVVDERGNALSGRDLAWSSSNSQLVTVSASGLVTANGVGGPVTITVTSETKSGVSSINVLPIVTSFSPSPFGAGDTVAFKGRGLASATLSVNGVSFLPLNRDDSTLQTIVSNALPSCTIPLPQIKLSVSVGAFVFDTTVVTLGQPIAGPASTAQHAILPAVAAGCKMLLAEGRYGLAVYTLSDSLGTGGGTLSASLTMRIRPQGAVGSSMAQLVTLPRVERSTGARRDAFGNNAATRSMACAPPRRLLGDTLTITINGGLLPRETLSQKERYGVYAVTDHYVFLARPALFDTIPPSTTVATHFCAYGNVLDVRPLGGGVASGSTQ